MTAGDVRFRSDFDPLEDGLTGLHRDRSICARARGLESESLSVAHPATLAPTDDRPAQTRYKQLLEEQAEQPDVVGTLKLVYREGWFGRAALLFWFAIMSAAMVIGALEAVLEATGRSRYTPRRRARMMTRARSSAGAAAAGLLATQYNAGAFRDRVSQHPQRRMLRDMRLIAAEGAAAEEERALAAAQTQERLLKLTDRLLLLTRALVVLATLTLAAAMVTLAVAA